MNRRLPGWKAIAPAERLNGTQLAELTRLADETGVSLSMLDTLPLWQIAMVLQATRAQRLGLRGDYGIDYQLLNAAGRATCPSLNWKARTARLRFFASFPMTA